VVKIPIGMEKVTKSLERTCAKIPNGMENNAGDMLVNKNFKLCHERLLTFSSSTLNCVNVAQRSVAAMILRTDLPKRKKRNADGEGHDPIFSFRAPAAFIAMVEDKAHELRVTRSVLAREVLRQYLEGDQERAA
jgi:hypothetical protein